MYTLHNYWRSSCSFRVRIALEWKAIAFVYRSVDLPGGQQRAADYSALSPNHVRAQVLERSPVAAAR